MNIFGKKNDIDFLKLLVQAAENALEAANLFKEAMNSDQPPSNFLKTLKEFETKGDEITHEIYKGLNQVFITPLDREDIMELSSRMDDVTDGIEATIARFDYLKVDVTDQYMKDFSNVIVSSCEHILKAFQLLSRKKYSDIHEQTKQINFLENEGDRLMREGIQEIFTHQKDPYQDFKLKEIYERLEVTTDACEDVADILESVVLRYA